MTVQDLDWAADRGLALLDRAADARQRATSLRGAAAHLVEHLSDLLTRRREGTFPAEPTSVRLAREAVAELAATAGVAGGRLDAIRLAVSEAASNVVVHAYPDGDGNFRLRAAVIGSLLTVFISDDGCGPHVPSRHRGLGVGLTVIDASTDMCTVRQRRLGGTEVAMRWAIAP